ncbi:MAG TPA: CU044_2847 family protein [Streptosporangiaceae bacterium]|nr:CU044_2847 family protein [Streptosporangiaceae bacterium]
MTGSDAETTSVMARLPNGALMKVEIADGSAGDGMASVGLRDAFDLSSALDTLTELSAMTVDKLKAARPTKATVEFRLGFAVESGRLTSMMVSGRGDASLTVTLEWSGSTESDG